MTNEQETGTKEALADAIADNIVLKARVAELKEGLRNIRGLIIEIRSNEQATREQYVFKHDGMVSSLRELQQEKEQAVAERRSVADTLASTNSRADKLLSLVREFVASFDDHEAASYWLNKTRTDDDHVAALNMGREAYDRYETAAEAAKVFLK